MRKFLLIIFTCPLLTFGQLSVGGDQIICLRDIVTVIGTTSIQPSTDSYQMTNINYNPEIIAGTPILLNDDDVQGPFPIGFSFQFYGNSYTDFYVGSNGWIGFSSGQPTALSAIPIPDATGYLPRDCIMLSWQDLNPSSGGQVLYQTLGVAPNRKFVLTFNAVPYYGTTMGVSSQVVLYEGSNVIDNHTIDKPVHTSPSVQGIHDLLGINATVVPGRNATIWSTSLESVRYFPSGITWYDAYTGQMIGAGDTLLYSPSSSTDIVGIIIDSSAVSYTDTMYVEVINTNISSLGTSLCNGPIVITAPTGFVSYSWNGASVSNTLTVNTPGPYYVNSTTSTFLTCPSDTIEIYSGNIPISLSTPDSVFICQGDTVNIQGPLGFSQYNWSTGATTNSIMATSTGPYSLSITDTNGCSGSSNVTNISISPPRTNLTSTGLSLCNGSITLDASSSFISFQWYKNGLQLFNASSSLIVNAPGSYHVEATYPTGCIATSDTLQIISGSSQFYSSIDSIGNGSLCLPNGEVILDAGNYATYSWSSGENTRQISVNLEGSYSVDVTDANGCEGTSIAPFIVSNTVNTSPISGPVSTSQFQTVTYSVVPTSGSTYDWSVIGGSVLGQGTNAIDVVWNFSGMFYFTAVETDINGCEGDEVSLIVNVIVNSVEDLNPNNNKINKITDFLGRETNKYDMPLIYIYDNGKIEKRVIVE